jgi:hypothetical protein
MPCRAVLILVAAALGGWLAWMRPCRVDPAA